MTTDNNNNNINDKAENLLYIGFGFFPLLLAVVGVGMVSYGVYSNNQNYKDAGKDFMLTGWGGTGATLVQRKFIGQKNDEPN